MFIRTHFKAIKNSASNNFPQWLEKKSNELAEELRQEEGADDGNKKEHKKPTLLQEVKKCKEDLEAKRQELEAKGEVTERKNSWFTKKPAAYKKPGSAMQGLIEGQISWYRAIDRLTKSKSYQKALEPFRQINTNYKDAVKFKLGNPKRDKATSKVDNYRKLATQDDSYFNA